MICQNQIDVVLSLQPWEREQMSLSLESIDVSTVLLCVGQLLQWSYLDSVFLLCDKYSFQQKCKNITAKQECYKFGGSS